jgi:predicted regulator of Ras-like GTPase activity (Roadblock/LC7/MglB family)
VKNIIEPLTRIPGVRTAALVTTDGVLMAMHGSADRARSGSSVPSVPAGDNAALDAAVDPQALAGLATSWLAEITRAVATLAWGAPRHLVLRAARGTLIVCEAPGAILCVVLESGMQPEELRLPMGVTIARIQRHLRDIGQRSSAEGAHSAGSDASASPAGAGSVDQQPGIRPALPSGSTSSHNVPMGQGESIVHATGKGMSDVSGA